MRAENLGGLRSVSSLKQSWDLGEKMNYSGSRAQEWGEHHPRAAFPRLRVQRGSHKVLTSGDNFQKS